MNKKIIAIILAFIAATITIFTMKDKLLLDNIKFKTEYESLNGKENYVNMNVDSNNPFVYAKYDEIVNLLKKGTGIIYFGFPECPWCRNAVPVLIDAANELGVDKIYYFNALSMRDKKSLDENNNIVVEEEGTKEYKQLVELMYDELPVYEGLNDNTIKRLYFPTVVFVKDGKIVDMVVGTVDSQKDPHIQLTKVQYNELKTLYEEGMNKALDILCDEAC